MKDRSRSPFLPWLATPPNKAPRDGASFRSPEPCKEIKCK
jgi:hypothetical protein